jgi:hypothetical protein
VARNLKFAAFRPGNLLQLTTIGPGPRSPGTGLFIEHLCSPWS